MCLWNAPGVMRDSEEMELYRRRMRKEWEEAGVSATREGKIWPTGQPKPEEPKRA